ncbi:DUF1772 domain-containing protein [Dinghuibacter silviterrae]|uniref:Uncharacterized protein n=1 Tax=Dinghuibacter silviterrae TaxID=1539049 RepID=A0A4R8DX61_9BACT|nr:DUF1772 domain-containing protein [Dinghuibacter silviterrae]TDX02027.1 hypothetical protein EDB95_3075 [Dinghuibacter silviterrae]
MSDDTLSGYRDTLQKDITDKEKEYHTTITYISAGALAFFLTLNDKFFKIQSAHGEWLMFASLGCLLLSIILYVPANMVDISTDRTLMDEVDRQIGEDMDDDDALLKIWRKSMRWSQLIYTARLIAMVVGVVLEAIFVSCNLS